MHVNDKRSFYLYTLIVFSIILLINIISYNRPLRIDLTDNQIFTLSNSTKSVLGKIDDDLIVSIYFSNDLPSILSNNSRFIQDMLEEYQAHSNGNIRFEFKNPDNELYNVNIYDIVGSLIYNSEDENNDRFLIEKSKLQPGIYVVEISFDNRKNSLKLVVN
mgnify:CR=1 FL=1